MAQPLNRLLAEPYVCSNHFQTTDLLMFKNYLKTALRNLKKNKIFSFINIFGLAAGLACCLLISEFVYDELSYDKYPQNASQIYRVGIYSTGNGQVVTFPTVDVAVGAGIKNAFPEVQSFTRLLQQGEDYITYEDKKFRERFVFVDSNFLEIFSIPFLEGNTKTALTQPNSVVISKAFAKKYFGDQEAMGKVLTNRGHVYNVTGVIDKIPDNSHFHFDVFMSMSTLPLTHQTWSNISFYTYLVLNKNADPKKLEAKFPGLVAKYVVPEIVHDMGVSLTEAQKSVNTFRFFLQPLTDIHLHSNTKYELEANGDIQYVYIFGALSVFILLLACINFTNLSMTGSAKRAREVGIRKVVGSGKKLLIQQFLLESVLLTYCAVFIAFIIAYALLPYFNQFSGKHIPFSAFMTGRYIITALILGFAVGILAGIYPAFFLSSFKAIKVLKWSSATTTGSKSPLRKGLVVFQFVISTGLIIATMVVYQQLHFMQNKKLGYDKEQVLYLQDTYMLGDRDTRTAFKETLLKDSRIVSASIGTDIPGNPNMDGTQVYPKDKSLTENGAEIHSNIFHIDYDYIPTLGIHMKEGRSFSRDFPTDSFATVINEAAVKELGWSDANAVGKTIVTSGQHGFKVIGVTDDFHYASVKQKIAPLMMCLGHTGSGLIIKIKTTDVNNLLADIKQQWNAFSPGAPFVYYFLDKKFASLYASEQNTGRIFTAFAVIAIVIACLGLFGLATYVTQQRTKEIGIRKVFGASVLNVLVLVSKEFLVLVFIAFVIAVPAIWLGMHAWLQDFAYRTSISGWIFVGAGFLALLIALLTISSQAIKAATANPVKSLKTE